MLGDAIVISSAIVGFIAALLALFAFFVEDLRDRVVRFLRKQYRWEDIPARIGRANRRVWVLQTWIPNFPGERQYWHQALSHRSIDFRVLLLDSELVPARLRAREPVSPYTLQNESELRNLARAYNVLGGPSKLQARFYSSIPFGPVYVIDDDVYWGIYLAHMDSLIGPAFRHRAGTWIGRLILESYERVWTLFESRTLGLESLSWLSSPEPPTFAMDGTSVREVEREIQSYRGRLARIDLETVDVPPQGLLVFVRHGETDLNSSEIFSGSLDVPLNATGIGQARLAAEKLRDISWDRILSSPSKRAIDTLRILINENPNNEARIEIRQELSERSMGELEGASKRTFTNAFPQYSGIDVAGSAYAKARGGESPAEVFMRMSQLLQTLVQEATAGRRVLVCSHEGPIQGTMAALEGSPLTEAAHTPINNGRILIYAESR